MTLRPIALLLLCLTTSACLVQGKAPEERRGEAEVVASPFPEVEGLDAWWRRGELPPEVLEGTPAPGGSLVIRINGQPPSLNALIESDGWCTRITLHNLHEALLRPDPQDHPRYRLQPELAESWEESADHRTFIFRLRRGVRWHDGKPFTARDVKFTFDRLLDPAVRAMHKRHAFADLESVETPDDFTVVVRYRQPYVWALRRIADLPILPAHAFAGLEGSAFNTAPYHRAPIGTGPFRFESWEDHRAITLARNDDYWGEKAWVDRVVYRVIPEPNVAQQLLLRGEIDIDVNLSAEQYLKLAAEEKVVGAYHRVKYYESSYSWIGWNHRKPLFADARVRRALAMLFDRERVRTGLYFGLAEPANCVFYHLGSGCDPATKVPDFDPDAAAALLEEAGWRDTDGDGVLDRDGVPFRFTLTIPSGNPVNEATVLLYQQALYRAGIEMDLQKIEWSVYTGRLRAHEFDACMLAWISQDVESDPFQVWHSSQMEGGSNYVSYAHPEIDRMAEAIRAEPDFEARQAIYRRFNQMVIDEMPILPVFHLPRRTLVHRRLRGAYVSPLTFFQARDIWISGEGR